MGVGGIAGVPPREVMGVGGRSESVADNAGDGIIMLSGPVGMAMRGAGWAMEPPDDDFVGDGGAAVARNADEDAGAMSTSTCSSLPFSTTMLGGVPCSPA